MHQAQLLFLSMRLRPTSWMLLILCLYPPSLALAQKPVFEATVEPREIVQGSRFEITYTLKDVTQRGTLVKAPDFKGLALLSGPHNMSGVTVINGITTTKQSWTYELEATKTGSFQIGSAVVSFAGKTLNSNALTVLIVPARLSKGGSTAIEHAGEDLFIVAETDQEQSYPGGQITWRIRLYTRVNVEGADLIGLPDFKGFYTKDKERFDTRIETLMLKGKKYAVRTLHETALFPQETGEITIGAARVRAGVEQPGNFGILMGPKPVLLQSTPLVIPVRPLPAPVPEAFSGGVGQYDWEVKQDRDSITTDESLTLRISIKGNGDARRFAIPHLIAPSGLEAFEPTLKEEEIYENGKELIHTKVIETVILPKKPGDYVLNPVLVFFDPDSNRYRELRSAQTIRIHVSAGTNYIPEEDQTAAKEPDNTTNQAEDHKSAWPIWAKYALLGLGLFVVFVVIYWFYIRKKESSVEENMTTDIKSSLFFSPDDTRTARENFYQTGKLRLGDARVFYDQLYRTYQAYLMTRLNLTPAQMIPEIVKKNLLRLEIPADQIQEILQTWSDSEQALFAGADDRADYIEKTWQQAESTVKRLESALKG
jgi:hypothetical protein